MSQFKVPESRKRVTGTYRPDRAKRRPGLDGLTAAPAAPEYLTAAAKAEWDRLAPLIAGMRTLTAADAPALELLSQTLATAAQAQAEVERDGLTVASVNGGMRAHPAVKILEQARAQATRLLIEFGLTPRARGHVEPVGDASPTNRFAGLR